MTARAEGRTDHTRESRPQPQDGASGPPRPLMSSIATCAVGLVSHVHALNGPLVSGYDSSSDSDGGAAVPALAAPQKTPQPLLRPVSVTANGVNPATANGVHTAAALDALGKLPTASAAINGCLPRAVEGSAELVAEACAQKQAQDHAPVQTSVDAAKDAEKPALPAADHSPVVQPDTQDGGRGVAAPQHAIGDILGRLSSSPVALGTTSKAPAESNPSSASSSASSDSDSSTSASDSSGTSTADGGGAEAAEKQRLGQGLNASVSGAVPGAARGSEGVRPSPKAAAAGQPHATPEQAAGPTTASQQPGAVSPPAHAAAAEQARVNGHTQSSGQPRAAQAPLSLALQPASETATAAGIISASQAILQAPGPLSAVSSPDAEEPHAAAAAPISSRGEGSDADAQPAPPHAADGRPQRSAGALPLEPLQAIHSLSSHDDGEPIGAQ